MDHQPRLTDRASSGRLALSAAVFLALGSVWLAKRPFQALQMSAVHDWLMVLLLGAAAVACWLLALWHGRLAGPPADLDGKRDPRLWSSLGGLAIVLAGASRALAPAGSATLEGPALMAVGGLLIAGGQLHHLRSARRRTQ